jgi:hypothetical protein
MVLHSALLAVDDASIEEACVELPTVSTSLIKDDVLPSPRPLYQHDSKESSSQVEH